MQEVYIFFLFSLKNIKKNSNEILDFLHVFLHGHVFVMFDFSLLVFKIKLMMFSDELQVQYENISNIS